MAFPQAGDGVLEDRLRNLILNNSDQAATPGLVAEEDQAKALGPKAVPKGGKKRPNQAQRRQMNAELTIPIDTRLVEPAQAQHPRRQFSNALRYYHQGEQQNQYHSEPSHSSHPSQHHGAPPYEQKRRSHGQLYAPASPKQPVSSRYVRRTEGHGRLENGNRPMGVSPADRVSYRGPPTLYNPGGRHGGFRPEQLAKMAAFLDALCYGIVAGAEIEPREIMEKENFRLYVEAICRDVVARYEYEVNGARDFPPETVELKCFGSLASGFATKAADMDLGLLSPMSRLSPSSPQSPIPRLIEGALLSAGFGARLLTQTRVPIIKLCEKPDPILRQGLLESRKRWEDGLPRDEQEAGDDIHGDDNDWPEMGDSVPKIHAETGGKSSTSTQAPKTSGGGKTEPSAQEELLSFEQGPNQTLDNYYAKAKRLLHRLGGRDVTHSNFDNFTEADFALLNKVAEAFIYGLRDKALRGRIIEYPAFYIESKNELFNHKSLLGVHKMVEGTQLVLSWEATEFASGDAGRAQMYGSAVQQWSALQHTKRFGFNPVWFNKELQIAVDALRQIPILQIMHLQQDQHEAPQQYYTRAMGITSALSAAVRFSEVHSQTAQRYIEGIGDESLRNRVREFAASTGTQALRTIARMHKSLHLAEDYERAIEKGLYHPEHVPLLQKYISILRRTPTRSMTRSNDDDYLIPIMRDELSLLDIVRRLPDPATFGPNKPRDKYSDKLEFPKGGVGVQCDINFSAHLALQNTLLLRCYSYTDPRVRPLILFVKHWAKVRDINTPYRGTLGSYGYVLMMLHYLINIAEPFVCPNLQQLAPPDPNLPPEALEGTATCQGYNVRFWRDERTIQSLAQQNQLTQNHDSPGTLLRGFFEYYGQTNNMSTVPKRGFDWGRDVISIRTHGGLLTKADKGWTGAKTVKQSRSSQPELESRAPGIAEPEGTAQPSHEQQHAKQGKEKEKEKDNEVKEVRLRYLFAIEDPFELDHNIARTVTHNGIVAIRDEFRRAWRIIKAAGGVGGDKNAASTSTSASSPFPDSLTEDLLEDVKMKKEFEDQAQFLTLLDDIHGGEAFESLDVDGL